MLPHAAVAVVGMMKSGYEQSDTIQCVQFHAGVICQCRPSSQMSKQIATNKQDMLLRQHSDRTKNLAWPAKHSKEYADMLGGNLLCKVQNRSEHTVGIASCMLCVCTKCICSHASLVHAVGRGCVWLTERRHFEGLQLWPHLLLEDEAHLGAAPLGGGHLHIHVVKESGPAGSSPVKLLSNLCLEELGLILIL